MRIDTLLGPSEFSQLQPSQLVDTTCVVFDILRFTTTATQALASGVEQIIPAKSIDDAVRIWNLNKEYLLAGERNGWKITAQLSKLRDFDLGNSPREFRNTHLKGKTVISTTTNGTRALISCKEAKYIMIASFLNLKASVKYFLSNSTERICLVCSGTHEENSYEDMLGAGAFADELIKQLESKQVSEVEKDVSYSDSTLACRILWQRANQKQLDQEFSISRNGRNLLRYPYLAGDVAYSAQRDIFNFAVTEQSSEKSEFVLGEKYFSLKKEKH